MTTPTYWLCLFNATTWQEFCNAGGTVMAFPKPVATPSNASNLLGYMTGISKWMAGLEVTSEPYFESETKIWKQATFPCRVKVTVVDHHPSEVL